MDMKYFSLFLILFSSIACGNKSQQQKSVSSTETVSPKKLVDEDDLLLRLSADLIAEPSNQLEKDQNAIVNYAIDKALDVYPTSTGLYYQVIEEGSGDFIQWGDPIKAHYKGFFLDGREFDSSYKRNRPMQFYVGNTIQGWNEGLQKIKPGGKIFLLVPSTLAYGDKAITDKNGKELIPANSVLAFEVEVLK